MPGTSDPPITQDEFSSSNKKAVHACPRMTEVFRLQLEVQQLEYDLNNVNCICDKDDMARESKENSRP